MDDDRAFIDMGLRQAGDALKDAAGEANLHLRPETLGKCAARRFRSKLRAVESIVRRLIILLATSLSLAHAVAKPTGRSTPQRGQPSCGLALMPVDWTPRTPPDFESWQRGRKPADFGKADIDRLLRRLSAVLRLIKNPDGVASRLARRIEKLRQLKLARPIYPLPERAHRLGAELGLIATSLPHLIAAAFENWYDTS
ncbi:MAG: hypothetical protein WA989_12185 [Henriciella sp.]|uniref:hypothetical protein n=1 Tax=Henriciella sp. TaxID=1968823 RepID=UPI003C77957F